MDAGPHLGCLNGRWRRWHTAEGDRIATQGVSVLATYKATPPTFDDEQGVGEMNEHYGSADAVQREAARWFKQAWDPDMRLGEWWTALAESGWGYPTWPSEWFGKGLPTAVARIVVEERRKAGALGPPNGVATTLAAPTIIKHGSDEQRMNYLPDIVSGRTVWCQLFSEPEAGSDLASVRTVARRDGDRWIVTGQKVWTSGAQIADFGILLARTNSTAERHRGLSYFVIDMRQEAVTSQPIKEMTGDAAFNAVFLDEAVVPADGLIGDIDDGWRVALTTLTSERTTMGAGSMTGSGGMTKLSIGRPNLSERVGDLAEQAGRRPEPSRYGGGNGDLLVSLARRYGKADDVVIRQQIAHIYSMLRIAQFTSLRARAKLETQGSTGPETSIGKLAASRLARSIRETAMAIVGMDGTTTASTDQELLRVERLVLSSPLWSIAGGTDEVQKNIIGERVLGLPKG